MCGPTPPSSISTTRAGDRPVPVPRPRSRAANAVEFGSQYAHRKCLNYLTPSPAQQGGSHVYRDDFSGRDRQSELTPPAPVLRHRATRRRALAHAVHADRARRAVHPRHRRACVGDTGPRAHSPRRRRQRRARTAARCDPPPQSGVVADPGRLHAADGHVAGGQRVGRGATTDLAVADVLRARPGPDRGPHQYLGGTGVDRLRPAPGDRALGPC